jgi:hypothetical protein
MTPRQAVAISNPCARAWDTLNGQFCVSDGVRVSILTVNK